ncbi:hypothetical protein OKW24_003371 [Peribacillus simplex]|nr:hypothetical protein [Peribacillus simplex]
MQVSAELGDTRSYFCRVLLDMKLSLQVNFSAFAVHASFQQWEFGS